AISPDGKTIVFTQCNTNGTDCDIYKAEKDPDWIVSPFVTAPEMDMSPATDGVIVAWESIRNNARSIYWKPVSGGADIQVPVTGIVQQNPAVASRFIAFENVKQGITELFDIYLYDTVTDTS